MNTISQCFIFIKFMSRRVLRYGLNVRNKKTGFCTLSFEENNKRTRVIGVWRRMSAGPQMKAQE
jgi:hypothetical protein